MHEAWELLGNQSSLGLRGLGCLTSFLQNPHVLHFNHILGNSGCWSIKHIWHSGHIIITFLIKHFAYYTTIRGLDGNIEYIIDIREYANIH